MYLKLGNLSPKNFAEIVESEFNEDELKELNDAWSQKAELTGPEDFHIFKDPSITIHIGSVESRALEIFKAANARKQFNREISFHLDDRWKA